MRNFNTLVDKLLTFNLSIVEHKGESFYVLDDVFNSEERSTNAAALRLAAADDLRITPAAHQNLINKEVLLKNLESFYINDPIQIDNKNHSMPAAVASFLNFSFLCRNNGFNLHAPLHIDTADYFKTVNALLIDEPIIVEPTIVTRITPNLIEDILSEISFRTALITKLKNALPNHEPISHSDQILNSWVPVKRDLYLGRDWTPIGVHLKEGEIKTSEWKMIKSSVGLSQSQKKQLSESINIANNNHDTFETTILNETGRGIMNELIKRFANKPARDISLLLKVLTELKLTSYTYPKPDSGNTINDNTLVYCINEAFRTDTEIKKKKYTRQDFFKTTNHKHKESEHTYITNLVKKLL